MKTIVTIPAFFWLIATLSSQVTLSGALSGNYADLSLAFAAIQSGGGSGTVHAAITADITTTQTAQLQSTNYRVIVRPVGNRSLTITAANKPLIHLNGTQHVVIDGIALSGDSTLSLISTATNSTAAVVLLENDATQNRVSNCTIRGGTITNNTLFDGVVALRNATGNIGCDQDTISGNIIREALPTALPFLGISMLGRSTEFMNNDCVIADNQVVNTFNPTGISDAIFSIRFNNGTQITGNHIYLTMPLQGSSATLAANVRGIEIGDGNNSQSGGFIIRGNWIGGTAPFCGGAPFTVSNPNGPIVFFGIFMRVGTELSQVDDNHITNLDLSFRDPTTPNWYFFTGIGFNGGNAEIGVQQGNHIGSDTSSQSIILRCRKANTGFVLCSGINDQASSAVTIANNRIGGIKLVIQNTNNAGLLVFVGINAYLGGGTIHDNLIGATSISNSIDVNPVVQDVEIDGIAVQGGAYSVERNRISGIRNQTGFASSGIRCYFDALAGNSLNCKHNYISDLQVPVGSGIDLAGISIVASEANAQVTVDIEQDTIRNLSIGGPVTADAYLYGIVGTASTNATTYFCSGAINNCLIENLDNQVSGASTGCAAIAHLMGYKTGFTVSGNNIRNLRAKSNGLTGIVFSPETPAMITGSPQRLMITRNHISGLINEHTGNVQVAAIEIAGRTPLVAFNRVSDLQTPNTTSDGSFVAGLVGFDPLGTQTVRFQNNMVALDHSTHGSAQAAGIYAALYNDISANQTNVEFNSVYIGGTGDAPSAAFLKEGTGKVSVVNNIFYNECTGTGTTHTAMANIASVPASWLPNASDHNYLVSSDPEALNLWDGEPQSISEWQTVSSGDVNSYTRVAGVSTFSDLLFVDKTTANLDLQLDELDEVLVLQNAGIPVNGITEDFFGNLRDPNTPDVGAREFATIVQVGSAGIPETEITVSPNPTTDFIDLRVSADAPTDYAFQLTDAQGKVLLQLHSIEAVSFQKRISLEQLPKGLYFLIVSNKAGIATREIMKI